MCGCFAYMRVCEPPTCSAREVQKRASRSAGTGVRGVSFPVGAGIQSSSSGTVVKFSNPQAETSLQFTGGVLRLKQDS